MCDNKINADITSITTNQNYSANRKVKHYIRSYVVVAILNDELHELVDCRLYDTGSTAYCCLLIHDELNGIYGSGAGKVSAYGKHLTSEAVEIAINQAGIRLDQKIGGKGENAIKKVLYAIGQAFNYEKCYVIVAEA